MKPSLLTPRLSKCIKAKLPVLLKGAPGIGKSEIIMQVAERLGMNLVLSHPVVSEPIDYKGLPGIVDQNWNVIFDVLRQVAANVAKKRVPTAADVFVALHKSFTSIGCTPEGPRAEFLPFGDLRALLEANVPTIAFLDDLGQAPACVQAACMQLLLARRVNGHKVSDHVVFIAATNRREDRAGVTGILEPVKSRFATIIELTVDVDDWIEWALQHEMPAELIGFVHFRPGLLHAHKATTDIVNGPCPRTMANAGRLIRLGIDDVETLGGAIGDGAAAELVGFLKVYKQLPNLDAILLEPEKADIPDDPAALYAVVSGLTEKAGPDNFNRVLKYGNRLPGDFSVLLVRDCIRKDPTIQNTKGFINWAVKHKDILAA